MNPQNPQASTAQPMQTLPAQQSPQGMPGQGDPTASANKAKANLGLINTMNEQLLQHKAKKNGLPATKAPQSTKPTEKENPTEEKTPTEEKEPQDMTQQFTDFKKEIEGMMDSKLGDIKRELQTLLQEEEDEEPKKDEEKTETTTTA